MTERQSVQPADAPDLDGHTMEELEAYLDAGRTPVDESIEGSPSCRNALAALERLREVTSQLVVEDARPDAAREASWVANILASIRLDARAGQDLPLAAPPRADDDLATTDGDLVMTEGALRGLVRGAGDEVPGLLIGHVRLDGELDLPTAAVSIELAVTIVEGFAIPDAVADLRHAVTAAVARHTARAVERIDVTVRDVQTLADIDSASRQDGDR